MRALYPPGLTNAEARASYVAILTDAQFVCTARRTARALATTQAEPVYRYLFSHSLGGLQGLFGAFHGIELFYVFASLEQSTYALSPGLRTSDRELLALVPHAWAAFAATGDPSTMSLTWPRHDGGTDAYVELASPPSTGEGLRTAKCDFWDTALP